MSGRAGFRFSSEGFLQVFCGRCGGEKAAKCERCFRAAVLVEAKLRWLQDSKESFGAWLDQEIRRAQGAAG